MKRPTVGYLVVMQTVANPWTRVPRYPAAGPLYMDKAGNLVKSDRAYLFPGRGAALQAIRNNQLQSFTSVIRVVTESKS